MIRMRRLMIDSCKAFMKDGTTPVGLGAGVDLSVLRARDAAALRVFGGN